MPSQDKFPVTIVTIGSYVLVKECLPVSVCFFCFSFCFVLFFFLTETPSKWVRCRQFLGEHSDEFRLSLSNEKDLGDAGS